MSIGLATAPHRMSTFDVRDPLEFLPVAAYACDASGVISSSNTRAQRLWGCAPEPDDPGQRYWGSARRLAPDGSQQPREQCAVARALQEQREFRDVATVIERADGSRTAVLEHAKPVFGAHGELLGAVAVLVEVSSHATAGVQARAGRGATRPLRVVIADDDRDAADELAQMLRALGHATRVAYDGCAALEIAADFRPQIALLDLCMPRLDGWELCRRLRARDARKPMVIAAVTGLAGDEARRQSAAAGFDLHLVKPVDPVALDHVLQDLVDPSGRAGGGNG
jgi:CheY-like chemotaxis protein